MYLHDGHTCIAPVSNCTLIVSVDVIIWVPFCCNISQWSIQYPMDFYYNDVKAIHVHVLHVMILFSHVNRMYPFDLCFYVPHSHAITVINHFVYLYLLMRLQCNMRQFPLLQCERLWGRSDVKREDRVSGISETEAVRQCHRWEDIL